MRPWNRLLTVVVPLVIIFFVSSAAVFAAPPPTGTAPIPSPILSGKKAFISNVGIDTPGLAAFKRVGYTPYERFYSEMQSWGRYELVAAPADADLVFEIRFLTPLNILNSYDPQLRLTILDAKTHFVLWTFIEPVQGAFRESTWNKNFSTGLTNLMTDVKKIAAQPVQP
jgi:hypothetical protein